MLQNLSPCSQLEVFLMRSLNEHKESCGGHDGFWEHKQQYLTQYVNKLLYAYLLQKRQEEYFKWW